MKENMAPYQEHVLVYDRFTRASDEGTAPVKLTTIMYRSPQAHAYQPRFLLLALLLDESLTTESSETAQPMFTGSQKWDCSYH